MTKFNFISPANIPSYRDHPPDLFFGQCNKKAGIVSRIFQDILGSDYRVPPLQGSLICYAWVIVVTFPILKPFLSFRALGTVHLFFSTMILAFTAATRVIAIQSARILKKEIDEGFYSLERDLNGKFAQKFLDEMKPFDIKDWVSQHLSQEFLRLRFKDDIECATFKRDLDRESSWSKLFAFEFLPIIYSPPFDFFRREELHVEAERKRLSQLFLKELAENPELKNQVVHALDVCLVYFKGEALTLLKEHPDFDEAACESILQMERRISNLASSLKNEQS